MKWFQALKPTRQWAQFRIRSMLCLIALVAILCGRPHFLRYHAVWRLGHYVGVDLRRLPDDEQSQVAAWIKTLTGPDDDDPLTDAIRENWLVHRSSAQSAEGLLYVVVMHPTLSSPGVSYCRLYLISHRGNLIRTFQFNVGDWPIAARFDQSRRDLLCLIVEASCVWSGETRQFYRVTDEYVELLRSELLDGTMEMGRGNLFDIDPKPPDWSSWEELLLSDRSIDQLRGLAAFWSYEVQERYRPWDKQGRASVDVQTKQRLEALSQSDDPWIREEAAAAVTLLDE